MSWRNFKDAMERYTRLPSDRRRQYIFRGQCNGTWPLMTTLDRFIQVHGLCGQPDRTTLLEELMREFCRGALNLNIKLDAIQGKQEWRILARHHGLPTPLLDFTESPYIAAWFALTVEPEPGTDVAIVWCLDRQAFAKGGRTEGISVVDDETLIRINPRAVEQRGVFLDVDGDSIDLKATLGDSLYAFEIDLADRKQALIELDAMVINARTLFRDLDAVVRMAIQRVSFGEVSHDH